MAPPQFLTQSKLAGRGWLNLPLCSTCPAFPYIRFLETTEALQPNRRWVTNHCFFQFVTLSSLRCILKYKYLYLYAVKCESDHRPFYVVFLELDPTPDEGSLPNISLDKVNLSIWTSNHMISTIQLHLYSALTYSIVVSQRFKE